MNKKVERSLGEIIGQYVLAKTTESHKVPFASLSFLVFK